MDAPLCKQWQDRAQLLVAHERFAADDRHMQRSMTIDEIDHAVDQRLPLDVACLAKVGVPAEMIVAVRITSRTAKRTLACDLDRERRLIAGQDATPSRK